MDQYRYKRRYRPPGYRLKRSQPPRCRPLDQSDQLQPLGPPAERQIEAHRARLTSFMWVDIPARYSAPYGAIPRGSIGDIDPDPARSFNSLGLIERIKTMGGYLDYLPLETLQLIGLVKLKPLGSVSINSLVVRSLYGITGLGPIEPEKLRKIQGLFKTRPLPADCLKVNPPYFQASDYGFQGSNRQAQAPKHGGAICEILRIRRVNMRKTTENGKNPTLGVFPSICFRKSTPSRPQNPRSKIRKSHEFKAFGA